jgi:hypothetical protein
VTAASDVYVPDCIKALRICIYRECGSLYKCSSSLHHTSRVALPVLIPGLAEVGPSRG